MLDPILIRQLPPEEMTGERPSFSPVIIGGEDVSDPVSLSSPIYIGKLPGTPSMQRQGELAGYAISRDSLYVPTSNMSLEGCFALWTPTREGMVAGALQKARGVEIWTTDVMYEGELPVVFPHVEVGVGLSSHIELLREATEYRVPITVRISGGIVYKQVAAAMEAGADAVVVSVHDTLLTPHPLGLMGLFPPAARAMHDSGGKKRGAKLMVEGEFSSGADILKALAMGADLVGVTSPSLDALEEGKLAEFMTSIEKECLFLMGLSGHLSQETLSADDLVAVDYNTATATGLKIVGYEKELPLWLH